MPAIRSLIVLIAFRATGVSESRRKFAADGFGMASVLGPYMLKMDGTATVRLLSSLPEDRDTPAMRRMAPNNFSVIFMIFSFLYGAVAADRDEVN
jgi:hypothetical protein